LTSSGFESQLPLLFTIGRVAAEIDVIECRSIYGDSKNWPDIAVCEYSDMGVCAPCRMIRMGSLKYSYAPGFETLPFDLEKDPLEL
jgi:hypothetical protein